MLYAKWLIPSVLFHLSSFVNAQLAPSMQPVGNSGSGGVSYLFTIGAYEVTNAEYAAFLNAVADTDTYGLYNSSMGSQAEGGISRTGSSGSYTYTVKTDFGDKPVNYVRWLDCARFVNWLENHQPTGAQGSGTTEDGVYTIGTNKALAYISATRNAGTRWFIPSDAEWKKAARYDPSYGGFWTYATKSNTVPTQATCDSHGVITNPGSNVVNYDKQADWNGTVDGNVTTVGSAGFASRSYYSTADQHGNVREWCDTIHGGALKARYFTGGSLAQEAAALNQTYGPSADGLEGNGFDGQEVFSKLTGFRIARLCPADFDGDGDVDEDDIDAFDQAFDAEDPSADLDESGEVDLYDYLDFVNAYNSGC